MTFERIADDLRQQIREEKLRPGQLLPTQSQLMQEYKASSLTVQKAIRLLRNEGWVIARQGRGTFVTRSADFEEAFENVASDLQQQIYTGTLAPGAKLPAREVLADHYSVPLNVVTNAIALLAGNFLLRYTGEVPGEDVYVRDWDDHGFATQLIHGRLVRKIRDGSLSRGSTVTVNEVVDTIGGDAEAADQALTFLALEGRVKKVHRTSGSRQESAYVIVGGEFGTELPVTVEPVDEESDTPAREFPSTAGLAELAYKLERALEQIDELQERVDRLERGQPSGAEAG
ncbi:GntR family transcriptional regulator [Streptomyces peucetius]|uniref:GntR family transcriptional regulator n=1 Tax=Streptomyces peucetius TaxID=1950 RepID=A0ABY6IF12_STRPE|nr:GntR family transcriptional regulator [Streptomyces peucetius]UYQ64492.1 GntR family transcriptional regulator [Streptomyces peucetius]